MNVDPVIPARDEASDFLAALGGMAMIQMERRVAMANASGQARTRNDGASEATGQKSGQKLGQDPLFSPLFFCLLCLFLGFVSGFAVAIFTIGGGLN